MGKLTWLASDNTAFPPTCLALNEPNGLLAAGGDLSPPRLLEAYRRGIFPWFEEGQPALWWAPDPRMVLFPNECHVSRSLKRLLKRGLFRISTDTAFTEVIAACAAPRDGVPGTWITPAMQQAYITLHHLGHAHSVEIWQENQLVGGLYGVALGRVFFGESMFSRCSNASKVAFASLAEKLHHWNYRLLDCQMSSEHLFSLGAREIPRSEFETILQESVAEARNKSAEAPALPNWREAWTMSNSRS